MIDEKLRDAVKPGDWFHLEGWRGIDEGTPIEYRVVAVAESGLYGEMALGYGRFGSKIFVPWSRVKKVFIEAGADAE